MGDGSRRRWPAEIGLGAVVLMWGFNFPVCKAALEVVDPLLFNAVRFSLSVALLALLWAVERGAKGDRGPRWTPGLLLRVVGLGLLGHALYQVAFVLGLARTSSGSSALILAGAPIWTALLTGLLGIERPSRAAWLGLGVAFAGTLVLVAADRGAGSGESTLAGNLLTLVAACAWGSYTALNPPFLRVASSTALAFWTMAAALPVLWLAALPALEQGFEFPREAWGAAIYAGLLASGFAYVLWNHGIRHVGPSQTAVWANLVPVVALVAGATLFGEQVSGVQLLGGAAIVGGLVWMRRARGSSPVTGAGVP